MLPGKDGGRIAAMKHMLLGVVLIAMALGSGCSKDQVITSPTAPESVIIPWVQPPPVRPDLTVQQLLSAPDSLRLDSTAIAVGVYLDRDFELFSPPDGTPMAAVVLLSPPFSDSTAYVYLWVIRDSSDVWATTTHFNRIEYTGKYNFEAFDGPKWGPDIYVDVVIGVRKSPTLVLYVLLPHVLVNRSA
jgi:hypothetical protein